MMYDLYDVRALLNVILLNASMSNAFTMNVTYELSARIVCCSKSHSFWIGSFFIR